MKDYKCRQYIKGEQESCEWLDVLECSTPEEAAAEYAKENQLKTGDLIEVMFNGIYMVSSLEGYQAAKLST